MASRPTAELYVCVDTSGSTTAGSHIHHPPPAVARRPSVAQFFHVLTVWLADAVNVMDAAVWTLLNGDATNASHFPVTVSLPSNRWDALARQMRQRIDNGPRDPMTPLLAAQVFTQTAALYSSFRRDIDYALERDPDDFNGASTNAIRTASHVSQTLLGLLDQRGDDMLAAFYLLATPQEKVVPLAASTPANHVLQPSLPDSPGSARLDYGTDKSYLPLDEAAAVGMPTEFANIWHEAAFAQLAMEQPPLWTAIGEKLARPFVVEAARHRSRRDAAEEQIAFQRSLLDEAERNLEIHRDVLEGYTRREPHAKIMYLMRSALLLLGDIAGISSAAILLGLSVNMAAALAATSAIATVTGGLAGRALGHARLARRRASDTKYLPDEHRQFAWAFSGAGTGEEITRAKTLVGVTTTLLVVGGAAAFSGGFQSGLSGTVLGCIAGAVCLASGLNAYRYADEVADLLDASYGRYFRASKRLAQLSKSRAIAAYDAATAEACSIRREHADRGEAAARKVAALKYGISFENSAVLGHGSNDLTSATESVRWHKAPVPPDLFSTVDRDVIGVRSNGTGGS